MSPAAAAALKLRVIMHPFMLTYQPFWDELNISEANDRRRIATNLDLLTKAFTSGHDAVAVEGLVPKTQACSRRECPYATSSAEWRPSAMYRSQQDASVGAGSSQHYLSASTPSSSFSQTQFPSPLFALDPSLHNSPQHLHPTARSVTSGHRSPLRHEATESHGSMQPPSSVSPRLSNATPARGSPLPTSQPADRSLPSREVTVDTIADAYVRFILFCNPHFPLSTETSTLEKSFRSPPKSDNKDFDTYRLFELVKQFDAKEIKTWGQLALDLGVEAPDLSKGQSTQKVQQYTVRLKRWMRAMHVDAFFEYLLGKQHAYLIEIPHPSEPYPSRGRDGVLAEEDLAVRALDPSFRPKRGRRRNSDTEQDDVADAVPTGKDSRGVSSAYPMSALPNSAHPDGYSDPWAAASAVTSQTFAPWVNGPAAATTSIASSNVRWQLHGPSSNPATPHPMTAQPTSMTAHIDAAFDKEPKSAITSARKRRKHGPAVSSAWPSANTPGARPRGRPPASRTVQDGPYTTFPADPANERRIAAKSSTPDPVPSIEHRPPPQMLPPVVTRQSESTGRPSRLSLQVPQHTGGPVRLATPPRVLVNGETNDSESRSETRTPISDSQIAASRSSTQHGRRMQPTDCETSGFAFETLKRALTTDLLRADLVGRRQRLNGDEAKRLADSVLDRLGVSRQAAGRSEPCDDIARMTAASWLGLGGRS